MLYRQRAHGRQIIKRLAIIACVLVVATIAASAITVHFVDPRSLAQSFAATIKADTGRELAFSDVKIKLLPRPTLHVSQLRLGNAAWATQPWLVEVDRASVELDPLALLAGRLHARQIELSGVSAWLETDADGVGNWLIGAKTRSSTPEWLKTIEIDEIALQAIALDYRQGSSGETSSLRLDSLRIERPLAPQAIRIKASATVDTKRVEATATVGDLATLLANAPDYPVDFACRYGAARLDAYGSIDRPLGPGILNLALNVEAPEPDELFGASAPPLGALRGTARLTGAPSAPALAEIDIAIGGKAMPELTLRGKIANPRAASGVDLQLTAAAADWWLPESGAHLPPFRLSTRLRDDASGYRLDDFELSVADSRVAASLQVGRAGQRLRVSGQLSSPLIDLARLAPPTRQSAEATGAAKPRMRWQLAEQKLDLDLELKIGQLRLPSGHQLQSGSGRLRLDGGRLHADALQATLGGAKVRLDGGIADPQQLAGIDLDVSLDGSELAELLKFFGRSAAPLGAYHGRTHLSGSHAKLRASAINVAAGRAGQRLQASGQIDDVLERSGVALAITADVSDSAAAGRLLGADLPRLPPLHATARLSDVADAYAFDELKLALGHSALQGRVVFAPGDARPRVLATLKGPLVDLAELPAAPPRPGATKPLLAADIDATLHIDRVLLPNRRALGPLSGEARLVAGALELKQFAVAVDGAAATLDGRIGDPLAMAAIELNVDAKLTRSAALAALTGTRPMAIPAFTASARLTDTPTGYRLADLRLKHAATTLAGELAVTRGEKRLKVVAKASSSLLDLSELATSPGRNTKATARTRLIPDLALPLDLLKRIDGDVELRFDAVKFGDSAPLGPLLLRARLADGRLDAGPLQLGAAAEQMLSASATIDAGNAAWSAHLEGSGIDLDRLLTRIGHPGLITGGRTDLALQLRGRGQSLAAIVASLDGEVRLKIAALRAHNVAVNLGEGLLTRTLSLINPFLKSDPDTDIKCIAARLPVKHGVLTSDRRFAIETLKYNAVLNGTLDLRSERLDLAVLPIIKSGRGIGSDELSSIVRLRGTLAEPAVGVDAASVAKSAVSLGAAVATLGGWWLADAMLKQVKADPSPCATALAR